MVFNTNILAGSSGQGGVEAFRYYQLNITAIENSAGADIIILAEIELLTGGSSQLPTMTGNAAPSPNVVSVNKTLRAGTQPFAAFDGSTSTVLQLFFDLPSTGGTTNPAIIKFDLGPGNTLDKPDQLRLNRISSPAEYFPTNFTLEGSNDDSSYDVLLTVTSNTMPSQSKTYDIP